MMVLMGKKLYTKSSFEKQTRLLSFKTKIAYIKVILFITLPMNLENIA